MRLFACLIVAPQRGYDEPAILSYAISPFCPTSADGLHRRGFFVIVPAVESRSLYGPTNLPLDARGDLRRYRCARLAQDHHECRDMLEKIWQPSRQLPPLQWSVEWDQQPRYGARERPSTLPGIPLAPVARVDDGTVDDLCAWKVLVHLLDRRRDHCINGVGPVRKVLRSADNNIPPRRHDLQQNIGNLLPIGHVLE